MSAESVDRIFNSTVRKVIDDILPSGDGLLVYLDALKEALTQDEILDLFLRLKGHLEERACCTVTMERHVISIGQIKWLN